MLFNSYPYILVFLPLVLAAFHLAGRCGGGFGAGLVLLCASLVFYAQGGLWGLPVLCGLILLSRFLCLAMARPGLAPAARKGLLVLGLAANIGLLAFFKYAPALSELLKRLLGEGAGFAAPLLPLGVSFYVFKQISCLIDVSRGQAAPGPFLAYCNHMTFFPQLIAGPIVRLKELSPQLTAPSLGKVIPEDLARGAYLFCLGLFKKAVLADLFAGHAAPVFDGPAPAAFFGAWGAALAYAMQIYFDFSGYTDMALGSARMFGLRLPQNFNSPYKSLDIRDFWRRWHMTLSSFLRDYLYIPLGGSRVAEWRACVNVMVTFLICGAWHGSGLNFVIWGGLHGLFLVVNRQWSRLGRPLPRPLARALCFTAVTAAWIFFRAQTPAKAWGLLAAMAGARGFEPLVWPAFPLADPGLILAGLLALCLALVFLADNSDQLAARFRPGMRTLAFAGLLAAVGLIRLNKVQEFIYFQF